jgi:ubiquinone biosynthesis protein UbiJ
MPIQLTAAVLNHLLAQNSWALPGLARFAGKTVRFDIAPLCFSYTIRDDGSVRKADQGSIPDAVCEIAPSLLPRLAAHDENAHAEIRSNGDADLLREIFYLSRNLSWDVADDLSHFTGDIAAERIVRAAEAARMNLLAAMTNVSRATAEYLTEERPVLAKPRQVSEFIAQVDALRDDVARLEKRINHLTTAKRS